MGWSERDFEAKCPEILIVGKVGPAKPDQRNLKRKGRITTKKG